MLGKDNVKFSDFIKGYWTYYLDLEKQLLNTQNYVAFDPINFHTYSVEYLKLYQAVCSEVDVVGKAIARNIDENFQPDDKANNIYKWWYAVFSEFGERIGNETVTLHRGSFELTPWRGFETEWRKNKNGSLLCVLKKECTVPKWWSGYNKVKHERTTVDKNTNQFHFAKANLLNLCSAYAGLYILERAYMGAVGDEKDVVCAEQSELFEIKQVSILINKENGEVTRA